MPDDLHVVLGASGGAGGAVVRELAAQGKRVRAVSRSGRGGFPEGVEVVNGDVTDLADARRVCEGAAVVYNCANVPYQQWLGTFPAIIEGSLAGAAHAGAKLVFCDNLYMYGPATGPMTEATPRNATGKKGRLRARLEETLLQAHREGRVRVTIGRGSDFYGPFANSVTKDFVFRAILKGKRATWLGSLDAPHTMTYQQDFARGLVTLGEREEALGEVWHIPSGEPVTGRAFIHLVAEEAGRPAKMTTLGRTTMRVGGLFSPLVREAREVLYQFEEPFIMDTSKFEHAFGAKVTPLREGIKRTLEFYRSYHPHPKNRA